MDSSDFPAEIQASKIPALLHELCGIKVTRATVHNWIVKGKHLSKLEAHQVPDAARPRKIIWVVNRNDLVEFLNCGLGISVPTIRNAD